MARSACRFPRPNAVYGDGQGRSLRLSLNDTGGAQGLVQLAAWAGVEQERSWDGGYERDYRQDGSMLHERWDNASGSGEFGIVVGGRFAIHVAGQAANIDELKSAVASGIDSRSSNRSPPPASPAAERKGDGPLFPKERGATVPSLIAKRDASPLRGRIHGVTSPGAASPRGDSSCP